MPAKKLHVHTLPRLVAPAELRESTVVVIDLLRATTTITQALASGAVDVVPFLEVADAAAAAEKEGRGQVLLGGERRGMKIDGFDLGNSPAEYTPEVVAGKRVFLTTTNGTRALDHARLARRVLCGALVNLSVIVEFVRGEPRVDILCAGTGGEPTREDELAAGAIVYLLTEGELPAAGNAWELNDGAVAARSGWESVLQGAREQGLPLSQQVALELRETPGGRNLLGIELDQDLVDCADVDRWNVLGELDVREWRIVVR